MNCGFFYWDRQYHNVQLAVATRLPGFQLTQRLTLSVSGCWYQTVSNELKIISDNSEIVKNKVRLKNIDFKLLDKVFLIYEA